ncbi:MAG TPA: DUF4383 domain-containing protein [Solirubrobacteraceae bacterium]|nr:DUF4383 domain-containing protein [Solirubrobacteraceae bacterium]
MEGRTLAQVYALALGATLVLVGIVGFFVAPSFSTGDAVDRGTLIVFDINGWHNVVHLLSGVAGLALAGTAARARTFCVGYGVVYVLVTILGFIVGDGGTLLTLIPINTADNFLHLVIALTGIGVGLASPPATTTIAGAPRTA